MQDILFHKPSIWYLSLPSCPESYTIEYHERGGLWMMGLYFLHFLESWNSRIFSISHNGHKDKGVLWGTCDVINTTDDFQDTFTNQMPQIPIPSHWSLGFQHKIYLKNIFWDRVFLCSHRIVWNYVNYAGSKPLSSACLWLSVLGSKASTTMPCLKYSFYIIYHFFKCRWI